MNNTLVHQTLIEIEQNLKELESARNQVNSVSASSQSLVVAVSSIIKKIERLEKDLVEDRQNQIGRIDEDLEQFQTKLKTNSDKAIEKSEELHTNYSAEIQSQIENLSTELNKFKINLERSAKDASDQSTALGKKQNFEITNTIEHLRDFQEEVKKFNGKIASLDLNSRFESLRKNGETNANEINKKIDANGLELTKVKALTNDQSRLIIDKSFDLKTLIENHIISQNKDLHNMRNELLVKHDVTNEDLLKSFKSIKNSILITQAIIVIGGLFMAALIYLY
jgi:flagellar biosynthesis chaperone FliJ